MILLSLHIYLILMLRTNSQILVTELSDCCDIICIHRCTHACVPCASACPLLHILTYTQLGECTSNVKSLVNVLMIHKTMSDHPCWISTLLTMFGALRGVRGKN